MRNILKRMSSAAFGALVIVIFSSAFCSAEDAEYFEINLDNIEFETPGPQQDAVRQKIRLARSGQNWEEAGEYLVEGLALYPDDSYILGELAWCAGALLLGSSEPVSSEGQLFQDIIDSLPPVARHDFNGLILVQRNRYLSAQKEFNKALELNPKRTSVHFGLYICAIHLMEDSGTMVHHLQKMLDDPREAWLAVRVISESWGESGFSPTDRETALALITQADLGKVNNSRVAYSRAKNIFTTSYFSQARSDSLRSEYVEKFGPLVFSLDEEIAQSAVRDLPLDQALEFLDSYRERLSSDEYLRLKADVLEEAGRAMAAESLQAKIKWPSINDQYLRYYMAALLGTSDSLELFMPVVQQTMLEKYSTRLLRQSYEWYGQDEKVSEIFSELEKENVTGLFNLRLDALAEINPSACTVLLDSLKTGTTRGVVYFNYDSYLEEARGEPVDQAKLDNTSMLRRQTYYLGRMIRGTVQFGDMERAELLIRELISRPGVNINTLQFSLTTATNQENFVLAEDVLAAMEKRAPGTPSVRKQRFWLHVSKKEYDQAKEMVREMAADPTFPPLMGVSLVYVANQLDEQEAAESFLARMEAIGSDGVYVRMTRAELSANQGDHDKGQKILEELILEFPGHQGVRALLGSITGGVDVLSDMESNDKAHDYGSLIFDYEDVDWLRAAAAEIDTTTDDDVVYLRIQESYDLVNITQVFLRHRYVKKVLTKAAVESEATWSISFDPGQGVPNIIMIRVIDSDGEVNEIPRDQIFVSSENNAGMDVSESRQLVIPIPNLRVGSVIDLVWESESSAKLLTGTARRYGFFNALTRREHRLDIRYNNNLPIKFHAEGEGLVESRIEEDISTVRSWTMTDGKAGEAGDFTPGVFDRYPWVGYTTYESWDQIAREFSEVFWDRVHPDAALRELAKELTSDCGNKDEKIEALFQYVSDDINSVAIEVGLGRWIPTLATEVLERGYGDCKDKSALLLSLLAAVDIKGEVVLIGTSPGPEPHKDFPEFGVFDHALIYIPGWHGGQFCDPTLGKGCARQVPGEDTGMGVLRISSKGKGRLDRVPLPDPDDRGYEITIDMWIEPGGHEAIFEIETRYFSDFAGQLAVVAEWKDEESVVQVINDYNGVELWSSCQLIEHEVIPDGCGEVTLKGVYRDTTWSPANNNSVEFALATTTAKQYEFNPGEKRTMAVAHLEPHYNRALIRMYHRNGWEPQENNASLKIKNDYFSGSVEYSLEKDGDDVWLQAELEFRLEEGYIPLEEYNDFYRDWFALNVTQQQIMNFNRVIDPERVEALLAMAASDPEDYGFAIKAAQKILGDDVGGPTRDEGAQLRRQAALQLLGPALASSDVGSYPYLVAAVVEAQDLNFVRADSLNSIALAREPSNENALQYGMYLKSELSDKEGVLVLLDKLIQQTHSDQYVYTKISVLYELNRDDEVDSILRKIAMVDGAVDTMMVARQRFTGYKASGRFEKSEEQLIVLKKYFQEDAMKALRADLFMSKWDFHQSAEVYEELWIENPTNSMACNNLAWSYAMIGEELDQAETLVNASIALTSDETGGLNTLGAVWARQGHWKKARDLFSELYEADDRPSNQLVNGGFLALAYYELGKKDKARELWRSLENVPGELEWKQAISNALALVEEGKKPHGAFFLGYEED